MRAISIREFFVGLRPVVSVSKMMMGRIAAGNGCFVLGAESGIGD